MSPLGGFPNKLMKFLRLDFRFGLISILITIKGWFDFKKHEKDFKENRDKYADDGLFGLGYPRLVTLTRGLEGGEAEDNFSRM